MSVFCSAQDLLMASHFTWNKSQVLTRALEVI